MRNTKTDKNRRREEAETRMEEHLKLTIPERIKKAESRRGNSVREIGRLQNLLVKKKHHGKKSKKKVAKGSGKA